MEIFFAHITAGVWLWKTFLAIITISLIDLVLSGDNAAVIGLAIRNLPRDMQKKAAMLGGAGAVILRVLFTVFAVFLLKVKFLSAIGGVILIWITYNLIKSGAGEDEAHVKAATKFWSAIGTIIIADLSMAFDNVMGVAGAANGDSWLVVFGLLLSVPILILGATWLASLMEKWPIIIYIGAMVLMHTATNMIMHDAALDLVAYTGELMGTVIPWICAIPVLLYGWFVIKKSAAQTSENEQEKAS